MSQIFWYILHPKRWAAPRRVAFGGRRTLVSSGVNRVGVGLCVGQNRHNQSLWSAHYSMQWKSMWKSRLLYLLVFSFFGSHKGIWDLCFDSDAFPGWDSHREWFGIDTDGCRIHSSPFPADIIWITVELPWLMSTLRVGSLGVRCRGAARRSSGSCASSLVWLSFVAKPNEVWTYNFCQFGQLF